MIDELSILMPCYNNECAPLAARLAAQAEAIISQGRRLRYEIIVADDGSTDTFIINKNKLIDTLPNSRYIVRGYNSGRAAIRNYLARAARYARLLFIDSDMAVCSPTYLADYLRLDSADVAYGGYTVRGDGEALRHNLRYIYETRHTKNGTAAERNKHPYNDFHTSNFMIKRTIMLDHPFDERFVHYGYEDVLFGKTLRRSGVMITHIDNPLAFDTFETNPQFIAKTEEGTATLAEFSDELRGYSTLITAAERLARLHLIKPVTLFFKIFSKTMKNNLTGNKPRLLLLNIYKLGMFCSLKSRKRQP